MSTPQYLFVSRDCKHSGRLLVWIRRAKSRGALAAGARLRVVVVDDLGCRGLARRIGRVPSLVCKGMREPLCGLERIQRHLLKAEVARRRSVACGESARTRRSCGVSALRRDPAPMAQGRLPVGLDDAGGSLGGAAFSEFPRPQASVPMEESCTSNAAMRERKVASLESDLETLIAARNNLCRRGITRV